MRLRNFADEIKKFAGNTELGDITMKVEPHRADDDMYKVAVSGTSEKGDYMFRETVAFNSPISLQDYLDNQETNLRAEFPKSKVIVDRSL